MGSRLLRSPAAVKKPPRRNQTVCFLRLLAETVEDLDQAALQDLVGLQVAHPDLALVLHAAADGAADLLADLVPREGRLEAADELVEALVAGGLELVVVGERAQRGAPVGVAVL